MSRSWLHTESVCRYYQRGPHVVKAIDGVSLDISAGEFISVVGSSGSGKSTLLNIMAGLDRPTSGDVTVEGRSFTGMARRELARYRAHRVGMIFQAFNLVPHLTAQGNVELALFFNEARKSERHSRAIDILTRLGMSDRLDHRPADLSGGEQQRVAVARALVKKPEILFADEPTGNLDQENSNEIASILKEQNKQGLTVVMVTHNRALAESVSQRILRMDYGRVVGSEAL
jgi:putative ABC transport system ATP-binding protein